MPLLRYLEEIKKHYQIQSRWLREMVGKEEKDKTALLNTLTLASRQEWQRFDDNGAVCTESCKEVRNIESDTERK